MALGMKQDAVLGAAGTAFHTGEAIVQAPSRDPGDLGLAHRAETALVIPEKAKDASTPKRLSHMGLFSMFEVGFIGGIVGIGIPFHFNVSLDGSVTGVEQPNPGGLSLVVPRFTEEQPVPTATLSKVLLFAPARRLVTVSSSCPSP